MAAENVPACVVGSVILVKSSSVSVRKEGQWGRGEVRPPPFNPAGPRIVYGSSLQSGRSPSISPGTSSTRRTPAGERKRRCLLYMLMKIIIIHFSCSGLLSVKEIRSLYQSIFYFLFPCRGFTKKKTLTFTHLLGVFDVPA